MTILKDEYFMRKALELANCAKKIGEVPVGALIVKDGVIISCAYNRREIDKNPLAHAEIIAIKNAASSLGCWRLNDCELYVTLEPCHMCTGAIINARIKRVIYGAYDLKAGCINSKADFNSMEFNHKFLVTSGILENECSKVISSFFLQLRKRKG